MSVKTIGLCLSGGGHRASVFSLGALLYLVDANRHRDVKVISSVSGGSLTSGFLAVQPKPIHEMNREEFDDCAASWASQIAGSPAWWRTAFAVHALVALVWLLLVCVCWGWLPRLARFAILTPPWWETQVAYLAAVCVWTRIVGSRPGGTFWAWWGTWLYLGILLPAASLLILVWWSPLSWGWRLLIVILAACVFALRTRVADLAFRATVCRDLQLRNIHPAPRHIFCATEMQTGRLAFFSRDFIYSAGAGLGAPADLPLSTALQVSANFPVAFPYRIIRFKKHDFQLGTSPGFRKKHVPSLVLSDGGVHDNTGVTWFLEASERKARLRWFLDSCGSRNPESPFGLWSVPEAIRRRIEERLAAMEAGPDGLDLLVVNSSFQHEWGATTWLHSIPAFGEILALVRLQAVMYEHRGSEQSRQLYRLFFDGSLPGAVVSIEQHPNWVYGFLDVERNLVLDELGLYDLPADRLKHYSQRAQASWALDVFGPDAKPELVVLDARRRELRSRLYRLQAQQARAPVPSAEDAPLQAEIRECKGEMHDVVQRLRVAQGPQRADEVFKRLDETASSANIPTTFRPLGVSATAELLRHGYLNCMNICHLLLEGFPHFTDPPSSEELQRLARGLPRKQYPALGSTLTSTQTLR